MLTSIIPLFFINKVSKKNLWVWTMFGCCIGLVLFMIADFQSGNTKVYQPLIIVGTVIFLLFFECGPGPLPYLLYTQIFTNNESKFNSLGYFSM